MLLLCVVFALLTVGLVMPCVIDIATTPQQDFGLPSKQTWLLVVVAFWAFGAVGWLLLGRRDVRMRQHWNGMPGGRGYSQQQALRRHPAGRPAEADYQFADAVVRHPAAAMPARYIAPDDNPGFLLELDRRIREWRADGT